MSSLPRHVPARIVGGVGPLPARDCTGYPKGCPSPEKNSIFLCVKVTRIGACFPVGLKCAVLYYFSFNGLQKVHTPTGGVHPCPPSEAAPEDGCDVEAACLSACGTLAN